MNSTALLGFLGLITFLLPLTLCEVNHIRNRKHWNFVLKSRITKINNSKENPSPKVPNQLTKKISNTLNEWITYSSLGKFSSDVESGL